MWREEKREKINLISISMWKEILKRYHNRKGGRLLKEIGEEARREIEELIGVPIFLTLWVKVKEDWRKKNHS